MNLVNLIRSQASVKSTNSSRSTPVNTPSLFSKLNEQTTEEIFKNVQTINPPYISIIPYILLDMRHAFPHLPFFEDDATLSRIILRIPDALEEAHRLDFQKNGKKRPRIIGVRDDPLLRRLQATQSLLNENDASLQTVTSKLGVKYEIPKELLESAGNGYFSDTTLNTNIGRHICLCQNQSGWFLLPGLQNDVFCGSTMLNAPLKDQPYMDGLFILHGNDFSREVIKINIKFPENVDLFLYEYDPKTPVGISFHDSLFILKLLADVPLDHLKKFLKPWSKVLKHNENFQRAFQMLSAIKISSFGTYLSHMRVFSRHIINNGDKFHPAFQNLSDVVKGLFSNQIDVLEFKGFIFERLWDVKYRTVRAYFSGIIFFYEHCSNSKEKFWDVYPQVKQYLIDLGKRFDEIPQGSASLNWSQMMKLFEHAASFEHDLICTDMLFDLFVISFWCLLRTSEMTNLHFIDVTIFKPKNSSRKSARICIVGGKTSSIEAPVSFITINQVENPDWRCFCPIAAFERRFNNRSEGSTVMFTQKNGKKLTKSLTSRIFKDFSTSFRMEHPSLLQPHEKLTFYTFRISSLGFLMITVGFSLQEAQLMIRHAPGSKVTEQVYLAKSKAAAGASAREKMVAWMNKSNRNPEKVTFVLDPDGSVHVEENELDSDLWFQSLPEEYKNKFRNFFE